MARTILSEASSSVDRVHFPQTHAFDLRLRFRYRSSSASGRDRGDDAEAFWDAFREVASTSSNDWRSEATAELMQAEFERKLSASLGRMFSRRFLGRGHHGMMEGRVGEPAPASFYVLVKSVSFRCRVSGYSSLNLDMAVSGFQALADLFDRDFESFRVFFDPFLAQSIENAYSDRLAACLAAEPDFPQGFIADFQRPRAPSTEAPAPKKRAGVDPGLRAEWLWRLANGSLLVPVALALAVLIFGGLALRDLHRAYVDGLSRVLELATTLGRGAEPPPAQPAATSGGASQSPTEPSPPPAAPP